VKKAVAPLDPARNPLAHDQPICIKKDFDWLLPRCFWKMNPTRYIAISHLVTKFRHRLE
jgi:hypothetical protein